MPIVGDTQRTSKYVIEFISCPKCKKPRWTRTYRRNLVCRKCAGIARQKPRKQCLVCKTFLLPYCGGHVNKRFCSQRCHGVYATGKHNPNFKSGKWISKGYVLISRKGKQVREHRLIVEKILGRKLRRSEHIHHINGNKSDNRLANLRIMSESEHHKHHWHHERSKIIAAQTAGRQRHQFKLLANGTTYEPGSKCA